ncbi:MAG TPA: hypothetical protein VJO99_01370 [Burkholderiaceae bacterium]|nr:hypothetical protein [Burkholderiaceae bacterium]
MPSPRRRVAAVVTFGLALALAACAALLGPRTIDIPEARLQQLVARQFPLKGRALELLDINIAVPRLGLRPDTNRIATEFDLTIGESLLKTPYRGTIALSYGLRYEPGDRTVRLSDLRIERAELGEAGNGNLPGGARRQLDRVGATIAEKVLGDPVVYTLTAKDLEAVQGRGYQPGDIRVTTSGLTITLVPEAAR